MWSAKQLTVVHGAIFEECLIQTGSFWRRCRDRHSLSATDIWRELVLCLQQSFYGDIIINVSIAALRVFSLFIAWGGGGGARAEDFSGDQLIFRRTKGEISRNWEPKMGDRWKLWKVSERGTTQICLANEGMGAWGGASRGSSKVIRGDYFNEVTFKGGVG